MSLPENATGERYWRTLLENATGERYWRTLLENATGELNIIKSDIRLTTSRSRLIDLAVLNINAGKMYGFQLLEIRHFF